MLEGTLIAESLRVGTTLADLNLIARKISRYRAGGATPDQPDIWTALDFEADDGDARELAEVFARVLIEPGWYVNFSLRRRALSSSRARSSATRGAARPAASPRG